MVIVSTVKKVAKRLGLRNNSNSNSNNNNRGVANLIHGLSDAEAKKVLQAVANSIKNENKRKQIAKNENISRQLQLNENLRLAQQMSRLRANNTGAGPSRQRANNTGSLNRFTNANMNREYRKTRFNRVNVDGDGSCFYHAVLRAAGAPYRDNMESVLNFRAAIKDIISSRTFRNYRNRMNVPIANLNGRTLRQYLASLNNVSEWADEYVQYASAFYLNRRIVIMYGDGVNYRVYSSVTMLPAWNMNVPRGAPYRNVRLPTENPIYIYYDATARGVLGTHFQALIPKRP
jgi:hypothetical protein